MFKYKISEFHLVLLPLTLAVVFFTHLPFINPIIPSFLMFHEHFIWLGMGLTALLITLKIDWQSLVWPAKTKNYLWMVGMALIILIALYHYAMGNNNEAVIRVPVMLFCIMFVFLLYQWALKDKQAFVSWLMNIIIIAGFIELALGLIQIFFTNSDYAFWTKAYEKFPAGNFYQKNVYASFIALVVACFIFVLHCSNLLTAKQLQKYKLLFFSFVLIAGFVLNHVESNVGYISIIFIFAIALFLKPHRKTVLVGASFIVLSFFIAQQYKTSYSVDRYHKKESVSTRLVQYQYSIAIMSEKPLLGHGFGSTEQQLKDYAAYLKETQNKRSFYENDRLTHPHNELFYWGIETGLIGMIAVLLIGLYLFLSWLKLNAKNKILMSLVLFPLALHSMVEFPFYASSLHLLVFLFFIIALVMFDNKTNQVVSLPPYSQIYVISGVLLSLFFCGIYFVDSLRYSQSTFDKVLTTKEQNKFILKWPFRAGIEFFDEGNILLKQEDKD